MGHQRVAMNTCNRWAETTNIAVEFEELIQGKLLYVNAPGTPPIQGQTLVIHSLGNFELPKKSKVLALILATPIFELHH